MTDPIHPTDQAVPAPDPANTPIEDLVAPLDPDDPALQRITTIDLDTAAPDVA